MKEEESKQEAGPSDPSIEESKEKLNDSSPSKSVKLPTDCDEIFASSEFENMTDE